MGRRRERRLAGSSAAGRRVKVDLSAESSGDLGGNSAQDDVGEDGDPKTHAEFQSLHTSSGQSQQNTLQLLEQYSDEDSDECHTEHNECAPVTEAKDIYQEEPETGGNVDTKELNDQIEQFLKENLATEEHSEERVGNGVVDFTWKNASATGTVNQDEHDKKCAENVISGWKMVLHEESNCYYYWNIETGETSWEVPGVFSQTKVQTFENNAAFNNEGKLDTMKEADSSGEGSIMESIDGIDRKTLGNDGHYTNKDSLGSDSDNAPCLALIKKCEILAERLKSVKSLNSSTNSHQCMKYMVEIEIRIRDIKALASCGSRLLPFWLHIGAHLNHLETGIGKLVEFHNSTSESGEDMADMSKDVNGVREKNSSTKSLLFSPGETTAEATSSYLDFQNHSANMSGFGPHLMSSAHNIEDVGKKYEALEAQENEFDCRQSPHAGEDEEIDVDMEVDEITSVKPLHLVAPGAHYCDSLEQSDVHDTITDVKTAMPGQAVGAFSAGDSIPPPDDGESVPPPPPDDEPCPPPPPEEAPDTSYLSSQVGSHLSFQKGDFALSYPVHNLQYYGQLDVDVAGTSLYIQPEGGHMCMPHYYDPVTNAYAVTSLAANPVDPMAYYYSLQMEAQHPGQSITSGTLGAAGESFPGTAGSSLGSIAETESDLLNGKDVSSAAIYVKSSINIDKPTAGTPETSSGTSTVPVSLASGSAAASKAQQSKVMRGKKRVVAVVPTMRTNKKVSGLVDKWNAVKEELSVEDEESEDAYEILEKKRQREIEEWRANQVASGAAKDNANFQPLGGDWRERVKRRKAEKVKESKESSVDGGKQKPDLVELAKGLPSGWQAYWDESSRKVYYGNLVTSHTTWTRPKV